jgi:D-glycero-D-manno-heptose 1,7-bisphosphate phosphatase
MQLMILDRDGVINEDSPDYVRSPEDFKPVPGSLEAIAMLTQAGVRVAVATNQSGLARGYFNLDALNAIHRRLHERVSALGGRIDTIAFCPHGPNDACQCRKPKPGLVLSLIERVGVSAPGVSFVGDSVRDLEAAYVAGVQPVLVRTGNGERSSAELPAHLGDVPTYADLHAAVSSFLRSNRSFSR